MLNLSLAEIKQRQAVLDEVSEERTFQDSKWGGPEHDDQHEPTDWLRFIHKQEERAKDHDTWPRRVSTTYRERLVKIAALAVAGIQSYDRKIGVSEYDDPPVECDAGCRRYKQKGQRYCWKCRATIDAKPLPSEVAAQEAALRLAEEGK